ncbi:hypothetical protein CEUSTIGMA_g7783.t1 [Chlamydomonas eustigma]|uniref:Major facilitator superfamily (MFS) profile domain-containing protein n=1 Tax=Chlamydomonas eustigma TaxID=1157962 RepID=A0A250XBA9_9CHLO|nr:hypothetical protein CEUSTIGMA_g7783.t1 [Chlamydomonas eustigma]|eukprot:GAX80344.1 hypothetical protein CEUSTIGMA_g7783.t1 [Chlamydomonas eustigma]
MLGLAVLQSSEVSIPDFCSLRPEQWSWTYPEQSIVAEYNLVCDSAWKVGLVNSFYFVGMAVGGPLLGALTDHYGRKKALYICTALGAVSCALSAAGSSYWLYFLWRFVNGMAVQGMSTADQVLVMEEVGADYRGRVGTVTQAHYAGGSCLLAVLAYTFPAGRSVVLACATVTALLLSCS